MDGGAWKAAVHGVAEGRTRLSDLAAAAYLHKIFKNIFFLKKNCPKVEYPE